MITINLIVNKLEGTSQIFLVFQVSVYKMLVLKLLTSYGNDPSIKHASPSIKCNSPCEWCCFSPVKSYNNYYLAVERVDKLTQNGIRGINPFSVVFFPGIHSNNKWFPQCTTFGNYISNIPF